MGEARPALGYRQVDVFSRHPFSGNGLTVFYDGGNLPTVAMQRITQEMRQFESIFLSESEGDAEGTARARVFTMEEELDFAGHPLLGAAAVLHERHPARGERAEWRIALNRSIVSVVTRRRAGWYEATMDQGMPAFGAEASADLRERVRRALDLAPADLAPALPMEMVSTGLPYLLVPLASGLERARIVDPAFEALLAEIGAKFVYVFDPTVPEGRTWDNAGRVEDVATGSAAGPLGAYLVRHGHAPAGTEIALRQGRFVGRPSRIDVRVGGETGGQLGPVLVRGDVSFVGRGELDATALATTALATLGGAIPPL